MYEADQKALYRIYAAFAVVLIALGAYVCFCIRAGGTDTNGLQSGTDREIGAVKEQQRQAGTEISRATDEVAAAENSIERAAGAISNSQGRAVVVQAGVEECQAILGECQALAGENASILGSLGAEAGTRTESSKKKSTDK